MSSDPGLRCVDHHCAATGPNSIVKIGAEERVPQHGNASHAYRIDVAHEIQVPFKVKPGTTEWIYGPKSVSWSFVLPIHCGDASQVGVNGVTPEALLSILVDHLRDKGSLVSDHLLQAIEMLRKEASGG